MFREKYILREEASPDGGEGGSGDAAPSLNPDKWATPDGEFQEDDGAGDGSGDDGADDGSGSGEGDSGDQGGQKGKGDKGDGKGTGEGDEGAGSGEGKGGDGSDSGDGSGDGSGDDGEGSGSEGGSLDVDNLPPVLKEAIQAHQKGEFDPQKFVQQQSTLSDINNASSENVVREYFMQKHGEKSEENPNGVEASEIDKYVSQLKENGTLDLVAKDYRPQLQEIVNKRQEAQYEQAYNQVVETQNENLNKLFEKTNNYDNLYGVKLGESDLNDFNEEVKDYLIPKKGEAVQPFYVTEKLAELLNNDETLYKMLYAATRETSIRDTISSARESTKEDIEGKLGLKPNTGSGRQSSKNNTQITPGLWSQPEQ